MARRSTTKASDEAIATTASIDTTVDSTPETITTASTDTESLAPQDSESQERTYSLDIDFKFTDKETGEVKYITNLKYSTAEDKISALGTKRQEYKIFIDNIYFGRASKYWAPNMYLKTKSQKEFKFNNGADLKSFMMKRAAEFGADKANLDEVQYKELIQSYGMTEEDKIQSKPQQAASLQQQTLFV